MSDNEHRTAESGERPTAPAEEAAGTGALGDGLTMEDIARGMARGGPNEEMGAGVDAILRIPVVMQVVLGSATMPVANLMKLGRGAVVPLDQRVGEPVDVVVNGRVIARGEVVVVDDDTSRFGVSLTDIVSRSGGELVS